MRDALYFAYTDLIRCIKDDRYKLIEYAGSIRHTQLFDLRQDPAEKQNLYGQKEHAAIVDRLRLELLHFRDQWDDRQHRLGEAFWSRCSI